MSILFKYLRKDLDDAKLIKDLKIWLDRAVGVGMILRCFHKERNGEIVIFLAAI